MNWKLLPLLCLAGCSTAVPTRTINIESQPQGARVFVGIGANEDFAKKGRQFIGTTPFHWTTEVNSDGTFKLSGALVYSMFVPPVAVFTAEPPTGATNLFTKREIFHGGTVATSPTKAPEGIFFDLTKP